MSRTPAASSGGAAAPPLVGAPPPGGAAALFTRDILQVFARAARVTAGHPVQAFALARALVRQRAAARLRAAVGAQESLSVPPIAIYSITNRCNLHCAGCYAHAHHRTAPELDAAALRDVVEQCREMGIWIVLVAGGEPLTRPEIFATLAGCPEITFPLFTNGLLMETDTIAWFRRHRHVIPVLSLEGRHLDTDARRGGGVYRAVLSRMGDLRRAGIFFGTSLAITSANFDTVMTRTFMREMIAEGSRLFFLVDYVPIEPGTESLIPTDEQRGRSLTLLDEFKRTLPALFVAFPGDERHLGGCMAAGRGFIHISADGRVEPCPAAPFSDVSVTNVSLRQALHSPFLRAIRESDVHLTELEGGCALWARREWVRSLLQSPAPVDASAHISAAPPAA